MISSQNSLYFTLLLFSTTKFHSNKKTAIK
uniref:Uncharacterized protein n=1 Tax=Siphoviridae sp. ctXZx16 TaxID=2826371 RepID=A0A8S5MKR3_9CAUD|nr:MAG TPA: hypothetical protein [Siphoviridae sp. ctXZx16]DAE83889.1 MAG TPA: hypothetical protein [Bacteriophage sp.]